MPPKPRKILPKPFDIVNIFYTVIDQLCTHSQMSLEELCNHTYTTSDQLKPFLDQLEQYDWINKIYQNKCLLFLLSLPVFLMHSFWFHIHLIFLP